MAQLAHLRARLRYDNDVATLNHSKVRDIRVIESTHHNSDLLTSIEFRYDLHRL